MNRKLKYILGTTEIIAFVAAILIIVGASNGASNTITVESTQVEIFVGILCFFSAMYGAAVGGLTGYLGVVCAFVIKGLTVPYATALSMAVYGGLVGWFAPKYRIREGQFGRRQVLLFLVIEAMACVAALIFIKPFLDYVMYDKDLYEMITMGIHTSLICALPMNLVLAILFYVVNIFYRDDK